MNESRDRLTWIDALRMTDAEHAALADRLDGGPEPAEVHEKRQSPRYRLKDGDVMLVRLLASERAPFFRVRPRNVSEHGLGFFHGSFIYSDTRCLAVLRGRDGQAVQMFGTVVRCRHVHGKVHEVGVRLDEPIDPSRFVEVEQ